MLLLCGWFGMCAAYLLLTCALVGASAGVAPPVAHSVAVAAMACVLVALAIGP